MSKTWKWILGIAAVLVVVAALGFWGWNAFGYTRLPGHMTAFARGYPPMMEEFERGGRGIPGDDYGCWHRPMMGGYDRFHSPMGGYYGFMPLPFLFFGGLLRLLFPLGVLALVAYFAYKKGVKDGALEAQVAQNSAPVETPRRGRKVA
jgi:hypothetical protein